MANDIVHVNLPPGFDPKKHLGALRRRIEQEHGDGFEIRSVNLKKSVATAVRQSAITEVSDDTGKYLEVNLPRDTKPSDGDKIAIQLKATHPGYEMTKFEPFLGTALLTKTDAATSHARASIANALGVKPWEVQVEPRRDGGYSIELPMTYVPSKHDEKLDEVATAMVGKPGWYVKTNALKRTAAIIPSEPPTFPAVIPFPFHDLKNAPRDKLLIGMQLAEPGKDNEPLFLDFEAAPHTQISGTSGSGKAQSVDSLIPVPVSERFPTGWAKVKDLRAGDRLYGKDGEEINLLGLSDELTVDLYEVHLSDGQVVTVGPEHLWRASNARQRNNYRQNGTLQSGGTAAFALRKEYAESLRAYAHQLKPGTFARASDIAKIAKIDEQWVHAIARENDISVEVVYDLREMPVRRRTTEVRHFAADEAFSVLRDIGRGTAMNPDEFIGDWLTAREIAFLTGIGNDKNAARKVTRLLQTRLVPEKNLETVVESVPHKRKVGVKTYPVAEMLDLIAEAHLRNYAEDGIHATGPVFSVISTEEMAKELIHEPTGAHNWSIEVAPAISGRTMDLPVAPYTFGAWLGDGARHSRSIVSIDREIVEQIVADGYPVRRGEAKPDTDAISYHFDGLRSDLNRIFGTGTIAEKYIPADYLRASYDQRLAVLQGLMDTDGTIDKNGSCELSLSDKRLAEDALELIRSLGIKASCSPSRPTSYLNENGEKVECKPRHRIHFTTQLPVFRLPRKAGRLPSEVRETQRHVYVTDIKKVSKGRVKCLRVDAIDGMYLTEGFIQTHNSVTLNTMITGVLAGGAELVIVDLAHKAIDFAWVKDYVRDGGWGCSSLEHQVTALALVYEEGQRRAKILAERGVTKWTELPKNEQFKPIFVLLDEVTGLIQMDDKPQGVPKDHPMMQEVLQSNLLRATMLSHMKKIAAEMRFVGIRMVLSSQVSSVNTGIPTALRMNLANKFLLGANPTDGNRRLSLSDPTSVPKVPENVKQDGKAAKGVGVAELEGQPPTVFKSFYAPTEALREALDQLGLPRTSRPEPTAMEIAKHTPSLDDEGPAAAPAYEGERAPSGRPAAEVLAEVKAKEAAAGIAWDNDVDPETGKRLTGYAKANAARHAAKVGGQKPKENLKTKGGDA